VRQRRRAPRAFGMTRDVIFFVDAVVGHVIHLGPFTDDVGFFARIFPVVLRQGFDAGFQLSAHICRDRVAHAARIHPVHEFEFVERAVTSHVDLVDADRQHRNGLLDDAFVARSRRYIPVAELFGQDHVLFGPHNQRRLITALAFVGALGRPLRRRDDRSVSV
jgi:hypothetical protein